MAGNANGFSYQPVISGDGQHVVFTSFANNLAPGDTNGWPDVFVRNMQTGVTTLVSANTNNTGSMAFGEFGLNPAISYDGRYVLYGSGTGSVILRDCNVGTNYWLGQSFADAMMTPDGHYVAFIRT